MIEGDDEGSKAMRTVLEQMATGDAENYPKQKVKSWFQMIWIAVIPGLWLLNYHFLDAATLFAHVRSVAIFYLGIRGWEYIPEFFDVAEEAGLVKDMQKQEEDTEEE